MRIVFGNATLPAYPQGGGHWAVRYQYMLGLRDLGHDVLFLSLLRSEGRPEEDHARIDAFLSQWRALGFEGNVALVLLPGEDDPVDLDIAEIYGRSKSEIETYVATADLLWNDCGAIQQPLLSRFRRRAFVDLDPGLLQASILLKQRDAPNELGWETTIFDHDVFFTVGANVNAPDCEVPTLALAWRPFLPPVFLPLWEPRGDPGIDAPFTSVTHWNWEGGLDWNGRFLSFSKRDAYLRYLDLPRRADRPFELAANVMPDDDTGDRQTLEQHGWRLVDPWSTSASPDRYRAYIYASRGEISCPKPIYRELRTGWFSDRSACYLAAGRPVLAESTGFESRLPTGLGLLTFTGMDEAIAGVREIDANYETHSRAARAIAEEHLDSRKCLTAMLDACAG